MSARLRPFFWVSRNFFPILLLLITATAGFCLAGCRVKDPLTPEERAWLKENDGKIIVNNESGWPPIIDTDKDGNSWGIVLDFQKLLEDKLNFRFKMDRPDTWENFMERFRRGEIDVNNNLQENPGRSEHFLFTKPYVEIPNAIIVRKEVDGSLNLGGMHGMTIAVTKNFAVHEYIRKNHAHLKLLPLENDMQCLLEVSTRNADAAVVNLAVASFIIERKGISNLRVAGCAEYVNALGFASRKDLPVLHDILEKGLGLITPSERDAIFRKWISLDYLPFYRNRTFLILAGSTAAAVTAVFVLVLLWNRSLKRQVNARTASIESMNTRLREEVLERKQAEENLRASHERFITVLDSIDAAVYAADMETHEILFMNKYMKDCFGRDMTGETCWQVFRGERSPCSHCTNDRLVDSGGNPVGVVVWKDRNPITGKDYVNYDRAIEWTDGRMVRLQISTDISELTRMEEQLQQARKMESVGRLAGGIAHDFNNMLSIISGNAEMVLEDIDPRDPIVSNLREIQRAAQRSTDLTRQLLAFARKQAIVPKVLDLNETIDGMLDMLQRLIGEDIDLAWLPNMDLWPIKMDPSQVVQVLTNLCVNARDSIEGIGTITVVSSNVVVDDDPCLGHERVEPGQYVMLGVSDTGAGMAGETVDKIFEPFFSTKDFGKGTGLGLATVYGIVKQNNGFINVSSEVGKGTAFKILFPRFGAEEDRPPPAPPPADKEMGGGGTLLLVEDEKGILRMTATMLERLGYKVLAASSPSEAVRIAGSYPDDIRLLMTDVVMPEMSGKDMADILLRSYPGLKCLFMSGYTDNVIAHHGVLDEDIHFINKPFSRRDLALKIREILDEADESST